MRKFALAFIMAKRVKEKKTYKHIDYNRKENQQPTQREAAESALPFQTFLLPPGHEPFLPRVNKQDYI